MKEKKTAAPPKLFDLTSLQREANRLFGYTAKQTLDLAQALYEKRLLTYPRTDSAFLTDDMGDTAAGIIKLLCGKFSFMAGKDFTPELGKVLNSKKVSDHHAIIPTMELAKTDLAALPESERNILTLSGARLLMATAAPHTFEAVTAVFECAGQSFTARGKTVLSDGWKEIDRRYRAALKNKPETDDADSDTEKTLPPFTEGQTFENPAATVTEHDTTPPKPHNEASLLSAMERAGSEDTDPDAERKGLGTPATRAAVIEKLVKGGFVERKGKQLLPTKDGINLVCVLPDTLTSPQLTAEWENNLTQIAKGKADPAAFMEGIENMARELVKTYPFLSDDKAQMFKPEREALGSCPRCGSPVYEGKKNYYAYLTVVPAAKSDEESILIGQTPRCTFITYDQGREKTEGVVTEPIKAEFVTKTPNGSANAIKVEYSLLTSLSLIKAKATVYYELVQLKETGASSDTWGVLASVSEICIDEDSMPQDWNRDFNFKWGYSFNSDYLQMCQGQNYDMKSSQVLFPKHCNEAHDELSRYIKKCRDEQTKRAFREVYENLAEKANLTSKKLQIVCPKQTDDLITEGQALHHCVGTYIERVAAKKCLIVFVRRVEEPEKPFVTVEVSNGKIVQIRGERNSDPTKEVKKFVDLWSRKVLPMALQTA